MDGITKLCKNHGESEFRSYGQGKNQRWRCVQCNKGHVAKWRRDRRLKLVEHAGGKCVACGYKKSIRALSFHHLDPTTKKFGISERGLCISWERSLAEIAKCILLCLNCHMEVEEGSLDATPFIPNK